MTKPQLVVREQKLKLELKAEEKRLHEIDKRVCEASISELDQLDIDRRKCEGQIQILSGMIHKTIALTAETKQEGERK